MRLGKRDYYVAKKKVDHANFYLVSNLVLLALDMVARNQARRPSIEKIITDLEEVRTNYFAQVGQHIEDIYLFEDEADDDQPQSNLNLNCWPCTCRPRTPRPSPL